MSYPRKIIFVLKPANQVRTLLKRFLLHEEQRFLNAIFERYIKGSSGVEEILAFSPQGAEHPLSEGGLPGSHGTLESGWWKMMLLRYGLAMHFSRGKDVLETCSGLGWGAYLLDSVAQSVTCVEINKECTDFSKQKWKTNNTWSGAWLGQNPEKIVLAPRRRVRSNEYDSRDFIPGSWNTL